MSAYVVSKLQHTDGAATFMYKIYVKINKFWIIYWNTVCEGKLIPS